MAMITLQLARLMASRGITLASFHLRLFLLHCIYVLFSSSLLASRPSADIQWVVLHSSVNSEILIFGL